MNKSEQFSHETENLETTIKNNNIFALEIYNQLQKDKINLFFSPYSISYTLAITYAGAKKNTQKQMIKTLHFPLDKRQLHLGFYNLNKRLNRICLEGGIELDIANALWVQKEFILSPNYDKLIKKYYDTTIKNVNFSDNAEILINLWIQKKTNNKIKNLIVPNSLDPFYTKLVLTNAIYFRGNWENEFKEENTKIQPFWVNSNSSVDIPLMYQNDHFNFTDNDTVKILELPYKDNALSMFILLPHKNQQLKEVENKLTVDNLNMWTQQMKESEVDVYLPKYKMESQFDLKNYLSSMGMSDAFSSDKSDFSGIGTDIHEKLHVSKIIHKACINVNEKGTVAAAATTMQFDKLELLPQEFRADHPYLFLIRENKTNSILFIGRVIDPSK